MDAPALHAMIGYWAPAACAGERAWNAARLLLLSSGAANCITLTAVGKMANGLIWLTHDRCYFAV